MSRMKDIYTELTQGIHSIEGWQTANSQSLKAVEHRIDGLLHLMSDMVKMEDQIRKMEENIERRLARMEAAQMDNGKLVDRLIEMTLVQAGQADQAVLHRAQSRLDTGYFDRPTEEVVDEDVWPPPGCDAMESIG